MTGKVVDADGTAVCGAWVVAKYAGPGPEATGPNSFTGLNGEYFLDNVRKGVPFRIVVNPYFDAEWKALRNGLEAVPGFIKTQRNLRTGGLARFASKELRIDDVAGLVNHDITLRSDPSATGIVVGTTGIAGPYQSGTTAYLSIPGRFEAELHMNGRTGSFVLFGVPPGQGEIRCDIRVLGAVHRIKQSVTIPQVKESVTRVELRATP